MTDLQPLSGRRIAEGHEFHIRVYYEDTDFSGVVYHANYLKYFERSRTEFLRLVGIHHSDLKALPEPLAFAVSHIDVRFHRPARIDDLLRVITHTVAVRGALFVLRQRAWCNGHLLAEATIEIVCINLDNRPRRLPKAMSQCIAACVPDSGEAAKNDTMP
ncbi:MAG: tol-pal system-associated acyl-CoA thioesterase [Asticcacaulis sp.]|nr:tol-pal system-associated acyl-CoA thioesterase [Asticcacaulis sp.]